MTAHASRNPDKIADAEARERLNFILVRTGGSDAAAFEELYRLTAAKLLGVSLRICGDRAAAEDVLQEVYLRVWHRASTFDPSRGSAIAWLVMIARNRSIDWIRARPPHACHDADVTASIVDGTPLAVDGLIACSEHEAVLACIANLEGRQRDAIRAAFHEGATYAEIARRHGVALGTAKSWVRRGLLRVKASLTEGNTPCGRPVSHPGP